MSSQKIAQVIDCGGAHVAAGFFSAKDGNISLDAFYTENIGADFTSDEEWITAVFQGLKAIHQQRKFSGAVSLVIPGHLLLTKFLKIPHVAKSKRDQIVQFEAQQNIPFPLNEVVWDYEVVADDGAEFEVALVAVKLEIIDQLCTEIARLGVEVNLVEPSCMAQYNAFHHTHSEPGENILIANIGGKSSNLLFISETGFFVRNITLAGNTVTQAIAEETGLDTADAEAAKWDYIAAAHTGTESASGDFSKHVDAFLRRLVMEATRSIVNFRRQSGEEKVDRIYVTGGGALVPGVVEHLQEKLNLPAEYYNPLEGIVIGPEVDADYVEGYRHNVGELLGCALREFGGTKTHFNLIPPLIARQIDFRRRKPVLMAAVALLVLALIMPIYSARQTALIYEENISELDGRLFPVQRIYNDYQQAAGRIDEATEQIAALKGLSESRANWVDFFNDIQQRLVSVEDVWLERMEIVRGNGAPAQQRQQTSSLFQQPQQAFVDDEDEDQRPEVRIHLSGRMLDRENPLERASPDTRIRVSALFESILESEYIVRRYNEEFDTSALGILRFDVTLVVDPDRPL